MSLFLLHLSQTGVLRTNDSDAHEFVRAGAGTALDFFPSFSSHVPARTGCPKRGWTQCNSSTPQLYTRSKCNLGLSSWSTLVLFVETCLRHPVHLRCGHIKWLAVLLPLLTQLGHSS